MACECGFFNIEIQYDSMEVVGLIQKRCDVDHHFYHIVQVVKYCLVHPMDAWFKHVCRESNVVDALAKYRLNMVQSLVFFVDPLSFA